MARRSQSASEQFHVDINSASVDISSVSVPVKVFYEYRRDVRVALGKDCVRLRMPRHCNTSQRESYKDWCRKWIHKQWDSNPRFRTTFSGFDIMRLQSFETFDSTFNLRNSLTPNKNAYARLRESTIFLDMPVSLLRDSEGRASEIASKLIHKVLARHYTPMFHNRVIAIHGNQFAKQITSVKLKNMSSKWGSCSSTGRMSFSTRLLFAPKEVQDYVIIHELCHLNELNHSASFWNLVGQFDQSYRDKEKWLRDHGHLCDIGFRIAE